MVGKDKRVSTVVLPPRPQTPNDQALAQTEAAISSVSTLEDKWRQRHTASQEAGHMTQTTAATIEASTACASRILASLEAQVQGLLQSRAAPAEKEDANPKGKKPPAGKTAQPTPSEPPAYRPQDIKDMTEVLLKIYRWEPSGGTAADKNAMEAASHSAGALLLNLKSETKAAITSMSGDPANKQLSVKALETLAAKVEVPVREVLQLPFMRGIDREVWNEVLLLRTKRIIVNEALAFLSRERGPVGVRRKGLMNMSSLTAYALRATEKEKQDLTAALKKQQAVRSQEATEWTDQHKPPPAGKGK
ncbi:hypothetical protein DIPPA_18092 [Diplonema papillatum]|nr:hypothetical protein DIPPA_18092 [Diplonema papillatum]